MLALIPDDSLRKDVEALMPKSKNSVERWNAMNQRIMSFLKYEKKSGHRTNANILNEIMLQFAYPRYACLFFGCCMNQHRFGRS